MNTEYRLRRLERTLGTLISWLPNELGSNNMRSLLDTLNAPEDPDCLEGPGRTAEEVAQNARELDAVAPTPADKFALMFTMNQQARMADLLNRFAGHLSACLNTYPSLRTAEHDAIFKDYRNVDSGPVKELETVELLKAALAKARERIKFDDPKILAMQEIDDALEAVGSNKNQSGEKPEVAKLRKERDAARSLVAAFEKEVNEGFNRTAESEKQHADAAISDVNYIFRLHKELRERVEKVIGHWRDTDWFREGGIDKEITVGVNEAEAIKLLKYLKP